MRKKPYTEIGITRIPCFKCAKPSSRQWRICALNSEYKGLCEMCNIELNKVVLEFMGFKGKELETLIQKYEDKLRE